MQAYSHADRVHSERILDPKRIQKVICQGTDIYDMIPEVHTYRELFLKWGKLPKSYSAIGLPLWVVHEAKRFKYLLPGGCVRE